MAFRYIRKVHGRSGDFYQVPLSFDRRVVTFTLRHLVTSNRRFIRCRGVTLYLSNCKRDRASLRTKEVILRLLVRRVFRLNRFRSIVMRNVSFHTNRTRRHTVRVRVFATNRLEIRSRTGFGRQSRLTLSNSKPLLQDMGLEGGLRRYKLS